MMSACGPQRRKTMSAPMSAIGVLSRLVLLTSSLVVHDPLQTMAACFAVTHNGVIGYMALGLSEAAHAAARFHDPSRRRGGLAARGARAEAANAGHWFPTRHLAR